MVETEIVVELSDDVVKMLEYFTAEWSMTHPSQALNSIFWQAVHDKCEEYEKLIKEGKIK